MTMGRVVVTAADGTPITIADLLTAATAPDRNLLTRAGRALQKHSSRKGSVFTRTGTTLKTLNQEGQAIVVEILGDPRTKFIADVAKENGKIISVIDAIAYDGLGMRFNGNATRFIGFREP